MTGLTVRLRPFVASGSALPFALLVAACAGDSSGTPTVRVTHSDSAGIQIVTTETSAANAPTFATLDSVPDVKIGALEGPPEEQFGSVGGVAPLSNGGVAVLDGQAAEIRVFSPDGTYVRTVGGKGAGPGELSFPTALAALPGDTLAVYDYRNGRITRFTRDGELGRVTALRLEGYGRPQGTSFFPNGSMVGQLQFRHPGQQLDTREKQTFKLDSAALVLIGTDGVPKDTIGVFPWFESVRSVSNVAVVFVPSAFARALVFAAVPGGVWAGYGDHFELRLLNSADGSVIRILRASALQRPLADMEAEAVFDSALANAEKPEQRRTKQEWYDVSPRPELRPAYDRLVVDDQGHLWLRDWPGAHTDSELWWVFDRDGGLLGAVRAPSHFHLMAVRANEAWGVVRDSLEVPIVVRFAVHQAKA